MSKKDTKSNSDKVVVYHHRTQGTGSEGVHIANVIKGLRELGVQVNVVSPSDRDPTMVVGDNPYAKKSGFRRKILNFVSCYAPQILFELMEFVYNIIAVKKLSKEVCQNKVDFIYERSAFFLFAGAKVSMKYNIPLIVEVNEVAGEKRVRGQVFIWPAKYIEKYVFNQADAIIVVSSFLKEKIADLGVAREKIYVIQNGADEKLFKPDSDKSQIRGKYRLSEDTKVIGFVGWFTAWHNLELLIDSFADISSQRNVCLMLVGDGALKGKISDMIDKRGVSDKVVFTGAVAYQNIPKHVNIMDICVIPGSNEYRSPIKLFEYMLAGKAVVAPRWEPIEMITKDGEDVMLFTADDRREMTASFEYLLNNQDKCQHMGARAREKILSKHLWIHNAERVIAIYSTDIKPKYQ
jgi:glycosyltransferase involved in cell wall biosynthesis